jgi:DNA phosphorothioation-dependent restriction protein DptF
MGEAGAIVGGHIDRNELRQDLYVPTSEDETLTDFFIDEYAQDGRLLVITGSAGDGKSALLSRAFRQAQAEGRPLDESDICMDATASDSKHETYDVALKRFLDRAEERRASERGSRSGIAINLGLAIDFFDRQGHAEVFPEIWAGIDQARTEREYTDTEANIKILNLGHRKLYETAPGHLGEGLLENIVEKFAFEDPQSPFHDAFRREQYRCPNPADCPLHFNAAQFAKPGVREQVTRLIAASGIIETAYLNPRSVLDKISSMILPPSLQRVNEASGCPVGAAVGSSGFSPKVLLWNSVFDTLSSSGEESAGHIDPAAHSSVSLDQELLGWGADRDRLGELLGETPLLETADVATKIRTALRRVYLLDESVVNGTIQTKLDTNTFHNFIGTLTYLNQSDADESETGVSSSHPTEVLDTVITSLQGWSGSINESDYVEFVDGVKSTDYRFLSKWTQPTPAQDESVQQTTEETTPGQMWIVLEPEGTDVTVSVPVTFELYQLMGQIRMGYNPNALDMERSEGMRLIQSRLSEFTNKHELVRVVNKLDEELFRVREAGFDDIEIVSGDNQ